MCQWQLCWHRSGREGLVVGWQRGGAAGFLDALPPSAGALWPGHGELWPMMPGKIASDIGREFRACNLAWPRLSVEQLGDLALHPPFW